MSISRTQDITGTEATIVAIPVSSDGNIIKGQGTAMARIIAPSSRKALRSAASRSLPVGSIFTHVPDPDEGGPTVIFYVAKRDYADKASHRDDFEAALSKVSSAFAKSPRHRAIAFALPDLVGGMNPDALDAALFEELSSGGKTAYVEFAPPTTEERDEAKRQREMKTAQAKAAEARKVEKAEKAALTAAKKALVAAEKAAKGAVSPKTTKPKKPPTAKEKREAAIAKSQRAAGIVKPKKATAAKKTTAKAAPAAKKATAPKAAPKAAPTKTRLTAEEKAERERVLQEMRDARTLETSAVRALRKAEQQEERAKTRAEKTAAAAAEKAAIKLVKEAEREIKRAQASAEAFADRQARAAERAAIRAQERADKKAATDANKAFAKGQREAAAAARNIIKGAELLLKEQRRQERTQKAVQRDEATAAKKLIRDAAAAAREISKAQRLTEKEEKALAKEIERLARDERILAEREQRQKEREQLRSERESLKDREERERLRARFAGRAERLSESEQKRFDKFVAAVPERIQRTKRSMERTKQTIELMKSLGESPDIVRGEKFFRRRYQAEEALDKKIERLQALRQPSRIFRKKTGGVARLQKQGVMFSFIDFLPEVIEAPANRSTLAASPLHKIEADRAFMLVDYAVRSFVPMAFLALGHKAVAERIKRLHLIKDSKTAQDAIEKLFQGTDTQAAILEPVANDKGAEEQRDGQQTKAALPFDAMAAAHRCSDFAVEFAAKKTNNADLAYEVGHMAAYALTCALAAGVDKDYMQSAVNNLFREARRSQVR